jgi:hypothetical protein
VAYSQKEKGSAGSSGILEEGDPRKRKVLNFRMKKLGGRDSLLVRSVGSLRGCVGVQASHV